MKKALSLTVLLFFAWLQIYQQADRGEDTAEALQSSLPTIHLSGSRWAAPAAPDQDPDNLIPPVVGQTLNTGRICLVPDLSSKPVVSFAPHTVLVVAEASSVLTHSPPRWELSIQTPHMSLIDRSPLHSLAPPFA